MLIEIPDHYATNVGGALVEQASRVIKEVGYIPGWVFQFEELWKKGLKYDGADVSFWTAIGNREKSLRPLLEEYP